MRNVKHLVHTIANVKTVSIFLVPCVQFFKTKPNYVPIRLKILRFDFRRDVSV